MSVEVHLHHPPPSMPSTSTTTATTMTSAKEESEEEDLWTEASNDDDEEKSPDEDELDFDGVPSETQLVLLCLDYLRDLRRAYPVDADLEEAEGLHGKYLSLAIYALSRCFLRPSYLQQNDPWRPSSNLGNSKPLTAEAFEIPSLDAIQQDVSTEKQANDFDDNHLSNSHRFFPLNGLASGPALVGGPLNLAAITAAGLTTLGARSRQEADREVTQSHLFAQFVTAVQSKGFFIDMENSQPKSDPTEEKLRLGRQDQVYKERFAKVVSKFRTKLATKAAAAAQQQSRLIGATSPSSAGSNGRRNFNQFGAATNMQMANAAVERQRQRREKRMTYVRVRRGDQLTVANTASTQKHSNHQQQQVATPSSIYSQPVPSLDTTLAGSVAINTPGTSKKGFFSTPRAIPKTPDSTILSVMNPAAFDAMSVCTNCDNPLDLEEAEKLKTRGNTHMQKKEYEAAAAAYTQALKLSPAGPQSHVYFSNRAAALLSLKKFPEAVLDSERSLALKPDYGKAHARLGLAHYIMGNYKAARDAYATSLKYEPDNKSSQNYLEKAVRHFAAQEQKEKQQQSIKNSTIQEESNNGSDSDNQVSQPASEEENTEEVENVVPTPNPAEEVKAAVPGNSTPTVEMKRSTPVVTQPASVRAASPTVSTPVARTPVSVVPTIASSPVADPEEDMKKQLLIQEREAEKFKTRGNSCMANRDYQGAVESYTIAIRLSPEGPQSHVYYSNRAAAYCYLERYRDAEWDSEQSLRLNPSYGKAHARLGLSRFFMADYKGAMEAYSAALEFDPNNAASKSYLLKAKTRLERQEKEKQRAASAATSLAPEQQHVEHGFATAPTTTA